ncbi:MAG: zinc-binding alcohol dehydrogenase family protein [Chromatiaceae bacterium]|nr:zinc-binding alcohol dehydrogenase family protein [Chromatiaceae bacterium]
MKAIGYQACLPIQDPSSLVDIDLPVPVPGPRDLLVEIEAISVNPVDTKIRQRAAPPPGEYRVLGWDASGRVRAVGAEVTLFKPGDEVWYAGARDRPGSNAEMQLVDERLAGHKPRSLSHAEAAALPLTLITAWELLFERLQVARRTSGEPGAGGEALLIIGAGGGVGSILTQLARQLTGLTVIGTAARPETRQWVQDLGAHFIVDHNQPLAPQLAAIGHPRVRYIAGLTQTEQHLAAIIAVIAPQGRFALIDDPRQLDIMPFKQKSVSIHWEFMFTRSLFSTPDLQAQHQILEEGAGLVDQGLIRTTLASHFGLIDASNLRRAHAQIESGQSRGKIVLEGFGA